MTAGDDPPDHAERSRPEDDLLGRSLALVRHLRAGCPWDARQTPASLRPYLLEEAHETAEAVREGDDEELAGELGDLLLNVAFQIVLAEERDAFGAGDVVRRLEAKMEARHPHVYGDADAPPDWEEMKARERGAAERSDASPGAGRGRGRHADDGAPDAAADARRGGAGEPGEESHGADDVSAPPPGLEPLSRALRVQQRAAALGFDWPTVDGALAKLGEETAELEGALGRRGSGDPAAAADAGRHGTPGRGGPGDDAAADRSGGGDDPAGRHPGGTVPDSAIEREVGDVLLAAVAVARHASVHPMRALEWATRRFERRFRTLVRAAEEHDLDLRDASTEQLEALWDRAKAETG